MKNIKSIIHIIPELTLICVGILVILSPHSRPNSLYFPLILLTVLFVIQLIVRNDMLGFSLGLIGILVTLVLILGRFPALWRLTHYTPRTTWIFIGHSIQLLTCLVMSILLIRKSFLSFWHKLVNQEIYPVKDK